MINIISVNKRHISRLSNHQSTACESVVKEVRGSAAWNSFIQKSTTGNSQAAPDYLGKTSNSLSNSPGAYDKLRPWKPIEEHLQKDFITLIQAFTSLPDINCALSESNSTRCMISSGAIPMGTPHAVDRASVDKRKIRPDICIVSFTEIIGSEQDKKSQKLVRYQSAWTWCATGRVPQYKTAKAFD